MSIRQAARTVRGTGPRPALFLHCTLASGRALAPLMERLGDRLTGTAIDLPGHGRGPGWDGLADYLGQAVDLAEGACPGPRDVVGHSFGGVVALALAVRRPDLVRSAVLVEPVFFAAARGTEAHARHVEGFRAVEAAFAAGDRPGAAERFTAIWGGDTPWPEIPEAHRAVMADRIHLVAASIPGLSDDSLGLLAPGRLDRVKAPVTLLEGGRTHPVVPDILSALTARLPHARREVVEDAGHMVPLTHPDAVAAAIAAHLDRTA